MQTESCSRRSARENASEQVTIGFTLTSELNLFGSQCDSNLLNHALVMLNYTNPRETSSILKEPLLENKK